MLGLSDLPGGLFHSSAAATNQDGSVIVGYSTTSGTDTGLSTREAAHLLGIPSGTVKTRMMRARQELREALT